MVKKFKLGVTLDKVIKTSQYILIKATKNQIFRYHTYLKATSFFCIIILLIYNFFVFEYISTGTLPLASKGHQAVPVIDSYTGGVRQPCHPDSLGNLQINA